MRKILIALAASFVLSVPAFASSDFVRSNLILNKTGYYYDIHEVDDVVYYYNIYDNAQNTNIYTYAFSNVSGADVVAIRSDDDYTFNFECDTPFGSYYKHPIFYSDASVTFSPAMNIFPYGTSDSDILAAFNGSFDPEEPVGITSVLVPRGNVLYFKAASDYVFGFEAEFAEYSAILGGGDVYGPWGDTYQRLSVESSLPVAGITFPRPNSTAISWEKGAPYNVLGQSKRGLYRTTVEADGNYIAFYNPAYQSVQSSEGIGAAEVGCNVWVSGDFDFIRIYPLQQLLDTSSSPDGYENYLNGTPDGDTVIWTDPDDNVSAPVSGGDNQEDEPISSVSLIEAIKRILRNILSEIENIFTFGFSAIRDLVDLMDEFVATFDDLYEWLPEECYTLLIACVSVAIVIGVFKVFL